ncbi:MAG: glycosyltransferase family 1 protein [Micrococcales bacterium]|nr:glycosyltransferase family 1 protein [Micrococcales bacterium]
MLETAWVEEHADDFDLMHVHFGFDALDPADLERWARALHRHRKALVVTAHDLRNPHHLEPGLHNAQLGVLLRHASRVITLTSMAAEKLRERWGVEALVLPHPHIVDEAWLRRPRPKHDGFVVGVHCKSLRANLDPLPVIEAILDARDRLPGLRLRVDVHTDVMTPGMSNHHEATAVALRGWEESGEIELHVHDYFDDDALNDYLQSLDVSVLPYRFGSHSGWLEACTDLGTWVAAPTCGFYRDQRECVSFVMNESEFRADSLIAALEIAHSRPGPRLGAEERSAERDRVARAHEELYAALLADRGVPCTSS